MGVYVCAYMCTSVCIYMNWRDPGRSKWVKLNLYFWLFHMKPRAGFQVLTNPTWDVRPAMADFQRDALVCFHVVGHFLFLQTAPPCPHDKQQQQNLWILCRTSSNTQQDPKGSAVLGRKKAPTGESVLTAPLSLPHDILSHPTSHRSGSALKLSRPHHFWSASYDNLSGLPACIVLFTLTPALSLPIQPRFQSVSAEQLEWSFQQWVPHTSSLTGTVVAFHSLRWHW